MSGFEWDPRKASENLRRHGVDLADAAAVLEDDFALTIRDPDSTEERFVTMGSDPTGRTLVVVYCWRGDRVRLISARKATRTERDRYQKRP